MTMDATGTAQAGEGLDGESVKAFLRANRDDIRQDSALLSELGLRLDVANIVATHYLTGDDARPGAREVGILSKFGYAVGLRSITHQLFEVSMVRDATHRKEIIRAFDEFLGPAAQKRPLTDGVASSAFGSAGFE